MENTLSSTYEVEHMDLDRKIEPGLCKNLAESIRRDIVETLKKKGISVRMVEVDVRPDRLNVSLNIRGK